ncbi:hypothetical protein XBFFL1_2500013 [Xenorhabdus bovienii str. feltiae Florida]|nr:hypothetical protein XBFFR1_220009 [Xenorhabdus bovienii str. feltiae France]CDG93371.1 hypothetical protein XBFFL1_2500013 [Xenorhabdus bovienii str. feltiae Florida]
MSHFTCSASKIGSLVLDNLYLYIVQWLYYDYFYVEHNFNYVLFWLL